MEKVLRGQMSVGFESSIHTSAAVVTDPKASPNGATDRKPPTADRRPPTVGVGGVERIGQLVDEARP